MEGKGDMSESGRPDLSEVPQTLEEQKLLIRPTSAGDRNGW